MIVSWPLEKETGKMGAACGRVLHTLETLLSVQEANKNSCSIQSSATGTTTTTTPVLSSSRPICLWDGRHFPEETVDEWGRGPQYCHRPRVDDLASGPISVTTCEETGETIETHEYKYKDETMTASRVWNDFCHFYWPELYYENHLIATVTQHQSQRERIRELQKEHYHNHHGPQHQQQHHQTWMIQKDQWDDSSAFVNAAVL